MVDLAYLFRLNSLLCNSEMKSQTSAKKSKTCVFERESLILICVSKEVSCLSVSAVVIRFGYSRIFLVVTRFGYSRIFLEVQEDWITLKL